MKGNYLKSFIAEDLKTMQSWDLDKKINYAKAKIVEFYEKLDGNVFISFSGGKDSTVLLHLVRSIYPDVKAVFFNTGLEYPEIKSFIKTIDNVEWLKPRKHFTKVWEEYGIPVVSKEVSGYINDVRNTKSDKLKNYRLTFKSYSIPKKWLHFTDKNFVKYNISNKCCTYFKKLPSADYEKETGKKPYVGTLVEESSLRKNSWIKHTCNMYTKGKTQSRPLSIWLESDIWEYINRFDLEVSEIYTKYKYERTGCFLCPYGSHLEDRKMGTNRFEKLKNTHSNLYKALGKIGIKNVLLDMGVPIRNDDDYMKALFSRRKEIEQWYEDNKDNLLYKNYFKKN